MWRFTKKLKNLGTSMAEVMIASAMAGALALVIAKISKNSGEVSKRADVKTDQQSLHSVLVSRLTDQTACQGSFSTILDSVAEVNAANLSGATSGTGISLTTGIYNKDGASVFLSKTGKYSQFQVTDMRLRYLDTVNNSAELYVTGTYKLSGQTVQSKPLKIPINVNLNGASWVAGTSNCAAASGNFDSLWTLTGTGDIYYNNGGVGVGTAAPLATFDITHTGINSDTSYNWVNNYNGSTYVIRPTQKITYTPYDEATAGYYQTALAIAPTTMNSYGDVYESFRSSANSTYGGRAIQNTVLLGSTVNWAAGTYTTGVSAQGTIYGANATDHRAIGVAGSAGGSTTTPITTWGADTYSMVRGVSAQLDGVFNANPNYPGQAAALYALDNTTGTFGGGVGTTYAGFFRGNVYVSSGAIELEKDGSALNGAQMWMTGYANDANGGSYLIMGKSRGASSGTFTSTQSGDALALLDGFGVNSSSTTRTATRIVSYQDGASGATYVPGRLAFFTSSGSADAVERMTIKASGNVGINTNNPQSYSAFNGTPLFLEMKHTGTASGEDHPAILQTISHNSPSGLIGGVFGIASGSTNARKDVAGWSMWTGSGYTAAAPTAYQSWSTRNSADIYWYERMRLTEAGNLGIGNSAPTSKLSVGAGAGNSAWKIYSETAAANEVGVYSQLAFTGTALYGHAGNEDSSIGVRGTIIPNSNNTSQYGGYFECTGPTASTYCMGLRGIGYYTTTGSGGRSYGTQGIAGNGTDGWNYGVYAALHSSATTGGTALFATTSLGDIDVSNANTKWAGYFVGPVWMQGSLGIGLAAATTPSYTIHVNGTAGLVGSTVWTNASDIRLKDVHGEYKKGLSEVLKLKPVHYSYKKDNALKLNSEPKIIGFVAQDVQKIFPEAVEKRKDGFLHLNVDPIHWASINAIKDLKKEIDENLQKFEAFKGENEDLSRKIASLEVENEKLKNELNKQKEFQKEVKKLLCKQNKEAIFCK